VKSSTRVLVMAAMAVAVLLPASASAATKFGAELTKNVQPSNSTPAHPCEPETGKCSRISLDAYSNPGGHKAPKVGTIDKIRIIAGDQGSFRLQLAKAKGNILQAKATYLGEKLEYDGQPDANSPYKIETFNVNVPVKKNDHLGIVARKTSMLRCNSGGEKQLIFQGPLDVGGPFKDADTVDGCWLLLEAIYE